MATTTFERHTSELHDAYTKEMLEQIACALWTIVYWFDNFAKAYYARIVTMDNKNSTQANYTRVAMYKTPKYHSEFMYPWTRPGE